jgi:hypothetical protein
MAEAVPISLEEMDAFLVESQGFIRIPLEEMDAPHIKARFCKEWIYEREYSEEFAPGCRIRIFSSLDSRGGGSRDVGRDAIRVVIVDPEGFPWCKAFARVHRVKGWRANLLRRIETPLEESSLYRWVPERYGCTEGCSGILRTRWGKKGSFLGCSNYPRCRNTEAIA